jgi:hypothetical protein
MKTTKKWNRFLPKPVLLVGMSAMALAFAFVLMSCDTATDSDKTTDVVTVTPAPSSVKSVQAVINDKTTVLKNTAVSSNGKLVSATYDEATGNYKLLYKIGRINDIFSHYVTNGIPGGKGYGLTYTTSKETLTSESLNVTVSESITAGVEVGVDYGVVAKASVENTVGISLSITETIGQAIAIGASYSYNFEHLGSDKLYAFAMFSSMDFYQVFTYDPNNGTAIPIKENAKTLVYYDILNKFSYQIYEYIPENEIEYKTLEAWGSFTPAFSSADTAILNSAKETGGTEPPPVEPPIVLPVSTSSSIHVYDGDSIKISEQSRPKNTYYRPVELDIEALEKLGYTKINITMSVEIRAENTGGGREIWLDIDDSSVWKINNLNVDKTSWYTKNYTTSVSIKSFKNSSVFRFGFNTPNYGSVIDWFNDAIWWFNTADVTFTAIK